MKRTLSLIGLLVVGMLLLFNPNTGLVTAVANDVAVAPPVTAEAPSTTGEPPPPEVPAASSPPTTTPPTTLGTYSVLGESFPSEFGLFQVEIVIESGEMVEVISVSEPTDRKSKRINRTAIPVYEEAAISTQSADFDAVSGATVTWGAYTASLQSALDAAGL